MYDKFLVAERLREIGALMRLRGGPTFRAAAYEKGALAVESVADDHLATLVDHARLVELPGVGKALAREITELARSGDSSLLCDLRAEFPAAIAELALLPGLSVKKAKQLHDLAQVKSLDDLERACAGGEVRAVRGFGAKTERKLLASISDYRARASSILLVEALELSRVLVRHVQRSSFVEQVAVAGKVRRAIEITDEVTLVAASGNAAELLAHFVAFPRIARIEERNERHVSGRMSNGVRITLHVSRPEAFGVALLRHTGSAAHLAKVEARAKAMGIALDDGPKPSEASVYRALDLAFIPPELRDGEGEVEDAARLTSPLALLEASELRGLVHCHTNFSDGRDTVRAMAHKADELGMAYLTITDHSPAAHYAGGVSVDRLKEQWDEIARVQEEVNVTLLRGTESDILADGALDYPDDVLEKLDVIIASVHARMKMDAPTMTRRLIAAMRHPFFKIWGHPLGRLLQRREPFACSVESVLDAIAESRAAIEINGDPYRLDLEPRWIRAARARGIDFVVSSDAHSTRGLENLGLGVSMARRGGLTRSNVLNTADTASFRRAVRPVRA